MPDHELPLAAFLAGDLDPGAAQAVDEHLLHCDRCWLAVQEDRAGRAVANLLRQPADPALADRIRLAVELAPARRSARRARFARVLGRRGAVAATVVSVVLAVLTLLAVWPQHHAPAGDSAALRQVVALASELPDTYLHSAGPVAVDPPRTLRTGGQAVTVQTYAFDGRTALVATSPRPFAMPPDAHMPTGRTMPWTIARGTVTVYCPHADVLLAGPQPADELAALASVLHLR